MAAVCEKAGGCGVQAIGRCRRCGQAFCGSHQAIKQGHGIAECAACARAARQRVQSRAAKGCLIYLGIIFTIILIMVILQLLIHGFD